jgi:pyruvate/2-oxoglutarate dehydrogenase complex dihydrolipoamide acyltransferase (E2) component
MAMAIWAHPADSQVYARFEVDMTAALAYARSESERAGIRVVPAHLVIRAVALALADYPEANAIVRWGRVDARKRINVFCQVAIPGKRPDFSGVLLRDVDQKPVAEIARELEGRVRAVRSGTDAEVRRAQRILDRFPLLVFRAALGVLDFLAWTLNLDLSRLGIPRDPFGGFAVTNVGSLGISEALAPLTPITSTPILVSLGNVDQKPMVRDGAVVIRPM